MRHEWPRLTGLIVDGRLQLGEFLREEAGVGVFAVRHLIQSGEHRVCVMPVDDPDAEARFGAWTAAMQNPLAGLLRVEEVGREVLDGVLVVFAVTERPDAHLADATAERNLTREEAAELVAAIAPALDALHRKGWALGGFGSEAIVSVDGAVKLLPHTLSRDAAAALADDTSLRRFRRAAGVAQTPVPPPRRLLPVLIACVVVLVLGLVALRAWQNHRATVAHASEAARRPNPIPVAEPPATATPRSVKPAPAAPVAPRQSAAPPSRASASGDWAVIAAIYRDYDAAERRARAMASDWDHGTPSVFPQRGQGRQYMVVLASGITAREAERIRELARESGLPRDTYVTKLIR